MPLATTPSIPKEIIVLGTGSWGSALALHLERQHHRVILWGHDPREVALLRETRTHDHYLPGIHFPERIEITDDLDWAFAQCQDPVICVAVPSHAFESMIQRLVPYQRSTTRILWATKGLSETGEFLHVVCDRIAGKIPQAVLGGPSFAKEVAQHFPTAVTIAANQTAFAEELLQIFHSPLFRIYLSDDILGVELGSIVKNVLAIGVGMSDGLGFGANARAALITRGLAELIRLGASFQVGITTFIGLSGIGDMVLTCTDNQSRNRRFGVALGQGVDAATALEQIGQVVEGRSNAAQLIQLARQQKVEMPICEQVYKVLFENASPQQAVESLLMRSPRLEKM